MAIAANIGSDRGLKKLISESGHGSYRVNDGLYIQITKTGTTSWLYRFQLNGRRREMGLGPYPEISLAKAREASAVAKGLVAEKKDPITEREKSQRQETSDLSLKPTFKSVALDYIKSHRAGWSNAKHAQQWENTLTTYAFPTIGNLPITDVTTDHVRAILNPIWATKNETASRVRSRIEAVIAAAKARGLYAGQNPALWKGHLETLLPKRKNVAKVEHHAALPYGEMTAFMATTLQKPGASAHALALVALTACRTSEVLLSVWDEFDFEAKIWTIPAARMKARREHKVPLSSQVVDLLRTIPCIDNSPFIFPGQRPGKPLSQMAMAMLLRRMGRDDLTVHGFRSTFRDWAAEETSFPNMVAEMALAHTVGNAVEAAYRRGDLLAKRRELMQTWADYCMP
jgi:integrase